MRTTAIAISPEGRQTTSTIATVDIYRPVAAAIDLTVSVTAWTSGLLLEQISEIIVDVKSVELSSARREHC